MSDKLIIKTLFNDVQLPTYETKGSAGMDVKAYFPSGKNVILEPHSRALIDTGLTCAIPEGYELQIRPRSGLAFKHGISVLNSPATLDSDFRGQIRVLLVNHSEKEFVIGHGDRIAQLVLSKVYQGEFVFVTELDETTRGEGGFGSTGV